MPKQSKKKTEKPGEKQFAAQPTNHNNGVNNSSTSNSQDVEYLENPVKSESDMNEYRTIKLSNGLKALLVTHLTPPTTEDSKTKTKHGERQITEESKTKTKHANNSRKRNRARRNKNSILEENIALSAAMCTLSINVGSFSDPPDVPCISRISRKMILTSSKKCSGAKSFDEFVTNCGGKLTSTADHQNTEFQFYVAESSLKNALHGFANCFIDPPLSQDFIDNERRLIETEDLSSVQLSSFADVKDYLLAKIASGSDQHPGCNLGPNYVTKLRSHSNGRIYEEVKKFIKRHYSANRMAFVIEACASLDTLEKYAKTYLSAIPNNELPPPDFTHFSYERCFDVKEFAMIYQIKRPTRAVVQSDYYLELNWPMPPVQEFYRYKPQYYIAWMFLDRGIGSLANYLTKKNWCTSIISGVDRTGLEKNSVYSLLSISVNLTKEGFENLKQVLDVVYSYIKFLRRSVLQNRLFERIKKAADILYSLQFVPRFAENCASVCQDMHRFMPCDYLTGSILYFEYNPAAIEQCLNLLLPEKANIIIYDKNFGKLNSVAEKWEEEKNDIVSYRRTTIAKDWIEHWNAVEPLAEFLLSDINVDYDFEITPPPKNPSEYPEKIYADGVSEIYYQRDTKYQLPVTHIIHCYCTPLPLTTPENAVLVDIFALMMNHFFKELLHSEGDANLKFQVISNEKAILVHVILHNANDASPMVKIANIISNLWKQATKKLFESLKQDQIKHYELTVFEPPDLVNEVRLGLVRTLRWSTMDKYMACPGLDFIKFKTLAKHFIDQVFVKCLVQGKMDKSDVVENLKQCIQKLKCKPSVPDGTNFPMHTKIHRIPLGEHCYRFYSPRRSLLGNELVSVTNYYQFPAKSFKQTMLMTLLTRFMVCSIFKTFRDRERVDDILVLPGINIFGGHGYSLCVSVVMLLGITNASVAETMIEKYRKALHRVFKNMSDEDWIKARESFIEYHKTCCEDLEDEMNLNLMELGAQAYVFHRTEVEIAAVNSLTINELQTEMMNLTSSGPHIRKLTIQCVGLKEAFMNGACMTQILNSQKGVVPLCGTARERAVKPRDYFITDTDQFKSELPTFFITRKPDLRNGQN